MAEPTKYVGGPVGLKTLPRLDDLKWSRLVQIRGARAERLPSDCRSLFSTLFSFRTPIPGSAELRKCLHARHLLGFGVLNNWR